MTPAVGVERFTSGDDGFGRDDLYALETEMFTLCPLQNGCVLPPPTIAGRFIRAKNRNRRCAERTGYFLLLQHEDEVLLAQRPPSGLCGLYCFPQFADEESLRHWLAQRQIAADNLTQLTAFRHTFSHFHLDIVPMWLPVSSFTGCMDEGNALWYNLAQPPSVVRRLPWRRLLRAVTHWRAGLARGESIKRG